MIDGIEKYYQIIAESIEERISGPWQTAWIDAIFYPDHMFYSGEYVVADGAKPKSFATNEAAENAFEEIRALFKNTGKPVWGRARFELHSDGKFKMNWGYDDCDTNGFANFDAEAEIKRMRELRNR